MGTSKIRTVLLVLLVFVIKRVQLQLCINPVFSLYQLFGLVYPDLYLCATVIFKHNVIFLKFPDWHVYSILLAAVENT